MGEPAGCSALLGRYWRPRGPVWCFSRARSRAGGEALHRCVVPDFALPSLRTRPSAAATPGSHIGCRDRSDAATLVCALIHQPTTRRENRVGDGCHIGARRDGIRWVVRPQRPRPFLGRCRANSLGRLLQVESDLGGRERHSGTCKLGSLSCRRDRTQVIIFDNQSMTWGACRGPIPCRARGGTGLACKRCASPLKSSCGYLF